MWYFVILLFVKEFYKGLMDIQGYADLKKKYRGMYNYFAKVFLAQV